MKKFFSVLTACVMLLCSLSLYSGAVTKYKAIWELTAKIGSTVYDSDDTINVTPGQKINVTLSFSNNYYAGPLCAHIYYNTDVFQGADKATFNTEGKMFEACPQFRTFTDWDDMAESYHNDGWPKFSASKLAEFKAKHHFLRVTMTPTATPVKSIDEDLITIEFTVSASAKNGATGQIVIPIECMRTSSNRTGTLHCGIYAGDSLTDTLLQYSDDQQFDCTKAVLNFKVGSSSSNNKGDVDGNGTINSSDALLVLQHAVGITTLNANEKKAADVNSDSSIDSSDALKILQFTVGQISRF